MIFTLLAVATFFLAYTNGANDNFKGVATLFGSGATNYRKAIIWATITTFAGSLCAIFLAAQLLQNFSGKGLVPDELARSASFLFSVGLGAALTVLLATLTGFPISTTHALTGGLIGAGLSAGPNVNFAKLGTTFFAPLLISPLIAVVIGATVYFIFHALRVRTGITEETCLCVDPAPVAVPASMPAGAVAATATGSALMQVTVDTSANCIRQYKGTIAGISCQKGLDAAHFLSAGAVSFARGLNDTPKIVALMLVMNDLNISLAMTAVAVGMALGGLLNAKKVGETMSKKIVAMNHGQGFTANAVTASLVLFASKLGVPVSTTHVSVGSIFGMGLVTKQANYKVIAQIAMSWVLTLPIAALLSALIFKMTPHA